MQFENGWILNVQECWNETIVFYMCMQNVIMGFWVIVGQPLNTYTRYDDRTNVGTT